MHTYFILYTYFSWILGVLLLYILNGCFTELVDKLGRHDSFDNTLCINRIELSLIFDISCNYRPIFAKLL